MPRAASVGIVAALLLLVTALTSGQSPAPVPAAPQATQDTAKARAGLSKDSLAPPRDTLAKTASKSRSDSVIVVKHHFDHREQIITGSVIMTCLALMMVTMNNYNPR